MTHNLDPAYAGKHASYFEDNRSEMAAFVPSHAKVILEVGCGNAAFAAMLKASRNVVITCIEPFEPAAVIARQRVDRVICSSIEDGVSELGSERFDCIVANDVLEHLVDPWDAVSKLSVLLKPEGAIVASVPNVRYLPVFNDYVLRGEWRYRQSGVLDRTHLRFFTQASLRDLFESSGLRVDQLEGINPTQLSWRFRMLHMLVGGALDDTRFKQLACVCRLPSAAASSSV